MEYLCAYCNKPYLPKRTDSLYCSHSCRQFAYVLRKTNSKGSVDGLQITTETPLEKEMPITEKQLTPIIEPEIKSVKTDKELSVKKDKVLKKAGAINDGKTELEFKEFRSRSVMQLEEKYNERNLWYTLSKFFDSKDEAGMWVSERYRCLVEVLLAFSEMKRIELDDLKEVCNAFTDLIRSKYFKCLHPSYPYIAEIDHLRKRIKTTCLKCSEEFIKYRLSKEQKQILIVTRFELSQFVPKIKFSQLKFREN